MSPPVRRRGLKLALGRIPFQALPVASRAEAWIETCWPLWCGSKNVVASRAEAWIETVHARRVASGSAVASRAEAWIETI